MARGLKHFDSRLTSPRVRHHPQSQLLNRKAKWVAVKGDQNASITTQLVKQKATWAAIEEGDHNASITTHIEKTKQNKKRQKAMREP